MDMLKSGRSQWSGERLDRRGGSPGLALGALCVASLCLASAPALAKGGNYCSKTASLQRAACGNDIRDNLATAKAICINLSDPAAQQSCDADASDSYSEDKGLCKDQYAARIDVCDALGEDRYDPSFDPANFDSDPKNPSSPNPYAPLAVGDQWHFQGGGEDNYVEVLDETKLIEGVTCIVVHDYVEVDGNLTEDTQDWIAHATDGGVWYCGEQTATYETYPGDNPPKPELIDTEGAWKTGRDGGKPGVLFEGVPKVGDVYRQEYLPGDAEDIARVLSTNYDYSDGGDLNLYVPQALAEHLCNHDCVVTAENTPIEPDVLERKYYSPGVGVFLEVDTGTGDISQLVSCTVATDMGKCTGLPTP